MSNSTNSDDDLAFDRPIVLGPAIAVAAALIILLVVAVLLFVRNRQARIARLRERVGLAESRVNALLKIQQMTEVRKGAKKQGSDVISKGKDNSDESVRDNDDKTPSLYTQTTQQTKLSQSIDHPFTSVSDQSHTVTECDYVARGGIEQNGPGLKLNGHSVFYSSSESLDDASHVAVVNQSLYNGHAYRGYIRGDVRIVQNAEHKRPHHLFDVLDKSGGSSSSQVEGWV